MEYPNYNKDKCKETKVVKCYTIEEIREKFEENIDEVYRDKFEGETELIYYCTYTAREWYSYLQAYKDLGLIKE